jgi:uncharacterized protein
VTLLTAVFVIFFRMSFVQSITATKLMNAFSSLVATAVFMWQGILNFKLGLLLGAAAFAGGLLGGKIASKLSAGWLRVISIISVLALAARILYAAIKV